MRVLGWHEDKPLFLATGCTGRVWLQRVGPRCGSGRTRKVDAFLRWSPCSWMTCPSSVSSTTVPLQQNSASQGESSVQEHAGQRNST